MARQKASELRTTMKVPRGFRDRVQKSAQAIGMSATEFLEKCEVVRNAD
jgi:hypothetical protein